MLTVIFWLLVVLSSVMGIIAGAVSNYGIIIFFLGYFLGVAGATIVAKYNSQRSQAVVRND